MNACMYQYFSFDSLYHSFCFFSFIHVLFSGDLQYCIVVVSILRQNTQYRIEFDFAGITHH